MSSWRGGVLYRLIFQDASCARLACAADAAGGGAAVHRRPPSTSPPHLLKWEVADEAFTPRMTEGSLLPSAPHPHLPPGATPRPRRPLPVAPPRTSVARCGGRGPITPSSPPSRAATTMAPREAPNPSGGAIPFQPLPSPEPIPSPLLESETTPEGRCGAPLPSLHKPCEKFQNFR